MTSRLRHLRKIPGTQRTIGPEETFMRVEGFARSLGVTRLADITGMDRIGVPAYCAIVPRSDDIISVYAGKGLRPVDAKVGALMEAIERQTILRARPPMIRGSFAELSRDRFVLDPRCVTRKLLPDYSERREYLWVEAEELISGGKILVPAGLAGYRWRLPLRGPFLAMSSTNGIASGNVKEEATCHALCELIERDAWTLADMGAHVIPWTRRHLVDPEFAAAGHDDFELFPSVQLPDEPVMDLFERAEVKVFAHDITSDLGIPTIFATVLDESFVGHPMVHSGLGTHPDAHVALRRALTEAAQSRCVDIQGVREDLCTAEAGRTSSNWHTRRPSEINRNDWTVNHSRARRRIENLHSSVHEDVLRDLDYLLSSLRRSGIHQVIVIEFTGPDDPCSAVRVIVPGLETWALDHDRLGHRAQQYWRRHA